jgi:hypothetical protein
MEQVDGGASGGVESPRPPRVFISYARESGSEAPCDLVRELWLFLRAHGIDAHVDLVAAGQRQDWALWMAVQIREADHILIVASPAYRVRAEGLSCPDDGRGVQWEARLIRDAFYANQRALNRFVPVILPGQTVEGIPDFLAPATATVYYVLEFTVAGAEELLRLLTSQPSEEQPSLGDRPVLPPRPSGGQPTESASRWLPGRPVGDWRRHAYVNHDKLFGAQSIVDAVAATIVNERGDHVVSVVGEGGVGKTAISYEAAQIAIDSDRFTRVAWVSATKPHGGEWESGHEPYRVTYWSDLQKEIATQLGLDLGPSRALWFEEFGRRMAELGPNERLLVIVDNLETVPDAIDAVQQLRRLGVKSPHRLVVTTRWELTPHVDSVQEHRVSPLSSPDALAFVRHIGAGDPGLRSAPDSALQPVLDVTGGTPFLIRLAVRQYLSSHHPLDHVLRRLRQLHEEAAPDLADQVRAYLYVESLRELERRHGEEVADALLGAFCVKGRGDAFRFAELGEVSGIDDEDVFGAVLSTACQLSLITSFGEASEATLEQGYTIHSLLYDFTCGLR